MPGGILPLVGTQMEKPEQSERPRPVTVIGWAWLIVAAVSLARAVVNLVLWLTLRPAILTILGLTASRLPQSVWARILLEHFTAITTVQALFWAAVLIAAWSLLPPSSVGPGRPARRQRSSPWPT